MKKALIYLTVVAFCGVLMSSCRSHGGDCPAYGHKVEVKKAKNI